MVFVAKNKPPLFSNTALNIYEFLKEEKNKTKWSITVNEGKSYILHYDVLYEVIELKDLTEKARLFGRIETLLIDPIEINRFNERTTKIMMSEIDYDAFEKTEVVKNRTYQWKKISELP